MAKHPHALARLIDGVKNDRDLSDEDLATRARRAGHQLSKQRIADLRGQDPLPSIVPRTIRALAAALQLPERRVLEAAIAAAGLPLGKPDDWSAETAIRLDPELSTDAKNMLLGMLAAARTRTSAPAVRPDRMPTPLRRVPVGQRAARKTLES